MRVIINFVSFCVILSRLCDSSVVISLNGDWFVENGNKSIQVPARVPGGIYTDLENNKIIGDIYYRFNDENYRWVGLDSWVYSRTFNVTSEIFQYQRINLLCEGLDTVSEVYLNGELVGKSDNMFVRYTFPVQSYLTEGTNLLEIEFESPVTHAKLDFDEFLVSNYAVPPLCPLPVQHGECHVNFIRKIQDQFSWDWGPAFPSVGIWKNISIEAFNNAVIRDITVTTRKISGKSGTNWKIDLQIFVDTDITHDGQVTVYLDSMEQFTEKFHIISDESKDIVLNASFIVKNKVHSWWPNGFGDQRLYNLTVIYNTSEETTTKSIKIGFRTVELVQERITNSTGLSFYFRINGQTMFMKGSNWIPAHVLPERVTLNYTRRLLQSAKDAHMNILRVWGGGTYETEEFYELADEMGIMLWHDLMFACAMYPPEDQFLSSVSVEVSQQIQRLQHHPSILLWSANNENEVALAQNWYETDSKYPIFKQDYLTLYIKTIRPIVIGLDPSRPFLSSSPSNGLQTIKDGWLAKDPQSPFYGDVHFYVYKDDTWQWSIYPIPRFSSEYGFQSWSSFETLSKISIPEDWNYYSDLVEQRQHHLLGNAEMFLGVCEQMLPPNNGNSTERFKNLIYLIQIFQAMSLKTESEHYLRHQNQIDELGQGMTMGALYWQLNEIWQSPSWSSLEYGGKWKMAHYFVENFFSPFLVSPMEKSGVLNVYLIFAIPKPMSNLTLTMMVYQWDNLTPNYKLNINVTQKGQFSQLVYQNEINNLLSSSKCPGRRNCFFYFILSNSSSSKVLSTNFLFLSKMYRAIGIKAPNLKAYVKTRDVNVRNFELTITTDAVAPFVWLEAEGIEGRFSNNGFLLVTPSISVTFHSWQNVTSSELTKSLKVHSFKNVYKK